LLGGFSTVFDRKVIAITLVTLRYNREEPLHAKQSQERSVLTCGSHDARGVDETLEASQAAGVSLRRSEGMDVSPLDRENPWASRPERRQPGPTNAGK
jgi:hypothetical protein